ncbi:ABC transporter substrate-binding protein [Corynebacterium caspium]|uniref:ABC transporter substrate-binding protein n=1 Tax=Corynebacterium caspium TaxID=234828 RepID=UPI00036C9D26|nr:ABC transporter substrate-binding protein [Corynebacterium caspium]WKD58522.1 Periplasmic binding protein [Corynebacterium caspium DSM 44850]
MLKIKLTAGICAAAFVLTACGGTNSATETKADGDFKPITIENCGFEMTIDKPISRIATLRQAGTENLFALDQQEKMIGTGSLRDAVLPKWQADYEAIPVLSKTVPTNEQLRSVDPDFIVTTQEGSYTKQLSGTREEWRDLGVATFVSNTECGTPEESGFELIFRDYEQLGKMLGAEKEAAALIKEQRSMVEKGAMKSGKKLTFLFGTKDGGLVYVDGKKGIANDIANITGSVNAFGNLPETRNEISMEAFADADPDYIVIADLSGRGLPGDTAAEKIAVLESHPAAKNMKAVREKKYIVIPGVGLDASVRSVEPLNIVAEQLKKDA